MRSLLLVLGVLFALLGAGGAHAEQGADADPCCCDDPVDDEDSHCCDFDGGRCCVSVSALPAAPPGSAHEPSCADLSALQPGSDAPSYPRSTGPPPTPPPIA